MVGLHGIWTIAGCLILNLDYTYILNIHDLVGFYGISTIAVYLMPNHDYT